MLTPIDGVILKLARDADGQLLANGQLVSPGQLVAQIAPLDALIADVDLIGDDVAAVRVGLEARARYHAWSDTLFAGKVLRLAPTVDQRTRALRAEVEIDNAEHRLRPGMFVEVTLIGERRENVAVVPRSAVADRGGRRVVFVLASQRVVMREVTLGLGDDALRRGAPRPRDRRTRRRARARDADRPNARSRDESLACRGHGSASASRHPPARRRDRARCRRRRARLRLVARLAARPLCPTSRVRRC